MNTMQKSDNEVYIDDAIAVCKNSDGLFVISSDTHTITLNEHGCVIAVPKGQSIAINGHGDLSAVDIPA